MKPQQLITELTGATDEKVANLQAQHPTLTLSRIKPDDCDSDAYEACLRNNQGLCGVCTCPDGDFIPC